ncbi:MAG: hypothetical protein JO074_01300, partial [Frankiales bacterium]|nr:hypothetical protein [Frankiales bacterium]
MTDESITSWLSGRLPEDWFTEVPQVTVDRDEILVVGRIDAPADGGEEAAAGRIARFRDETRERRMAIAREAEHRYGRKVAWGASCG